MWKRQFKLYRWWKGGVWIKHEDRGWVRGIWLNRSLNLIYDEDCYGYSSTLKGILALEDYTK